MVFKNKFLRRRWKNEIHYEHDYVKRHRDSLAHPINYDIIFSKKDRKSWHPRWQVYDFLLRNNLKDKKILILGCGLGWDAFCCAKLGAKVYAFDLSPDCIKAARGTAVREGLDIDFKIMPAEKLDYETGLFDYVIAIDILHHIDISRALSEIKRVSKRGATFILEEVYTHSFLNKFRDNFIVNKYIYPKLVNFVYDGNDPNITRYEKKLREKDIRGIKEIMRDVYKEEYFDFFISRIIPNRWLILNKIDAFFLRIFKIFAPFLGGRVLIIGSL